MGKKFDDIEEFDNVEIELHHQGKDYVWRGSYSVRTYGEYPSWDYPGDQETDLYRVKTDSFEIYDEDADDFFDAVLTDELLQMVIEMIEI